MCVVFLWYGIYHEPNWGVTKKIIQERTMENKQMKYFSQRVSIDSTASRGKIHFNLEYI